MNAHAPVSPTESAVSVRAIRIAVMAMGGEGGGVLANWLVDLAEHNGYVAQMTSVPGVAQRTGATLYYVEMFPKAALAGRSPVLALMPLPGDVDIVLASELMEAGRAIQRGIVTPDRTTLIASTHRVFAIGEKIALDDGRVKADDILEACRIAAKTFAGLDMQAIAESEGSLISAVMFGALAGAAALPFPRSAFEATIERGGVGVAASMRAFAKAFAAMQGAGQAEQAASLAPIAVEPSAGESIDPEIEAAAIFPASAMEIIRAGTARCRDWQDVAYARVYVRRLKILAEAGKPLGDGAAPVLAEAARQLALAMTYEDVIRVAELKIRAERFARITAEVKLKAGQILEIREYLHPRLQEIAEILPARWGRFLMENRLARRIVEHFTSDGRIVETSSIRGFLLLYAVTKLKPYRRTSLRYAKEQNEIDGWLKLVRDCLAHDAGLALEVAELRNLVKGYGDTHARGSANFARIAQLVPKLAGPDAAASLAALRKAALADETGARLAAAIAERGFA